jgi:sterol 3beta-glucosyltransferase
MASPQEEDATRRHVSRRIFKKNREGHQPTMEFPDRFKDLRDDADEDVLPPSQGPHMFMNMNQSIFGLIAAAGSNVNFNDRFEGQSSDEDDGAERTDNREGYIQGKEKQREQVAKTTILKKSSSSKEKGTTNEKHRRRVSGQLLRSLPQLPRLATRSLSKRSKLKRSQPSESSGDAEGDTSTSPTAESQSPVHDSEAGDRGERLAPVMSRMLEARAEMSSRPSFDLDGLTRDQQSNGDEAGSSALARKLKEIFEFDQLEEVIEGMTHPYF